MFIDDLGSALPLLLVKPLLALPDTTPLAACDLVPTQATGERRRAAAQAPAVSPRAKVQPLHLTPRHDGLDPVARRSLAIVVVLLHGLAGWALLQVQGVREAVVEAAPIMVSLLAPVRPNEPVKPQPAPPQPQLKPQPSQPVARPTNLLAAASQLSQPTDFVAARAEPIEALPVPARSSVPTTLSTPPAPVATTVEPPAAKKIAPNALRYLTEPRVNVPLLSRRLGESGMVHLRIVVDAKGNLKEASVKKSSGFERLDKQALEDIRSARFVAHMENGQALQVESIAVLSYELER